MNLGEKVFPFRELVRPPNRERRPLGSEGSKVNPMQKSLTQKDIVDDLKRLGLEGGAAVEVHSSLSSMGLVEGGALTVINALMDVVGEDGAIVMSAYLVTPLLPLTEEEQRKGITAKVRKLDEHTNCKTGMGIIVDTFCKLPNTYLGNGINRICAWGHDAKLHSQGYEYLLSIDGSVLFNWRGYPPMFLHAHRGR